MNADHKQITVPRWRVLVASSLALTMVSFPYWNVMAEDQNVGYPLIQRAFLREDFEQVTSFARIFIAGNPDAPEIGRVWLWLALSLDRLHRSQEALSEIDQLKAHLAPNHALWPEVLYWEGEMSRRLVQMSRARTAYQRLLDQYPTSTWANQARFGLGLTYLSEQAFEQAIREFHQLGFKQTGGQVATDALILEGLCYLRLERFKETVILLEPLMAQLRDQGLIAQASFYLGEAYSGLERYDEAIASYQRAVRAGKTSRWSQLAQFGLGWSYSKLDRCHESIDAFDRYLKQPEGNHRTEALFAQGQCAMRLGKQRDALARFEQIASRDPDHPLALESGLFLIDAYRRQERFALAKELVHTLLRRQKNSAAREQLQLRLGAIGLEQGNPSQARTVFALASQSQNLITRQAALTGLGDVQMFVGDLAQAKQFYEESVRVSEQTLAAAYARYQIGRINLQLGQSDEAVNVFEALTSSEDTALADDARLSLAIAYLNRKQWDLARPVLEAIRRDRPQSTAAIRAAYYQALLAIEAQDDASAQRLCEEVIARAPEEEEALDARLLLADLRTQTASREDVFKWLQEQYRVEQLSRGHRARLAKRLGDFARSQRDYARAIHWYQEASLLLPSLSAETTYWTASCYEEAGDIELAMKWYRSINQPPWRVRGQLATAKLYEREDRTGEAKAIYVSVAETSVPEAKVAQERLARLQEEVKPQGRR